MYAYNVAGTLINVNTSNNYLIDRMKSFVCNSKDIPDISVEIEHCPYIDEPEGHLIIEDSIRWMKKDLETGFHIYSVNETGNKVMAHIDTDMNWSRAHIRCVTLENEQSAPNFVRTGPNLYSFLLLGIVFRNNILNNGGIVMHASSIAWEGKGILFTAPSGTGKSTHVRLWEKYFGDAVSVVNDDTPVIRFREDTPMLCGTPWSGSSDKFTNLEVPVKAIVVLSQATENSIRMLSVSEALPVVMPRCFLPYFDEKLMEKAYMILEKILKEVPVYYLKCKPDEEAMELVHQCVK